MPEDVRPLKCDPVSQGELFLTFVFRLRDAEGEGNTTFRNVDNCSPIDRLSQLRSFSFSGLCVYCSLFTYVLSHIMYVIFTVEPVYKSG